MIRLVHCGDLHPNAKMTFAGKTIVDPATGKNQALTDLQRSLHYLYRVATARETRCDAALVTGDIFDAVSPTMDEVQVILQWVERLADEMSVVVISGNHDISPSGAMATALEPLKYMGPNVHVFERPASLLLNLRGQHLRCCCLPYPTKGLLLANEAHKDKSPEEITALIYHGLAAILRSFTLEIEPGMPSVLLAHGSVSHAKVNDQPRSLAHDILIPLAECAIFDFAALGHIHQHQQISANAWYSGSLMRNGFGEEKEVKGFNLVEVEAGQAPRVTFIENPHARVYRTVTVAELERGLDVEDGTILRVKDQLTPAEHEATKAVLEQAQRELPYLQLDLEIVQEDRTRDAGMAQCLTIDEALARALEGKIETKDMPGVLEKHHRLMQEVGA